MAAIKDLHKLVTRVNAVWSRAGYALILFRHDRDGNPYVYHCETFYGNDGRKLRSAAIARGNGIINRTQPFVIRDISVPICVHSKLRDRGIALN